jgi:bifunctional non-homologous end joining protein LigD
MQHAMIHTCVVGGWTEPRGSRPFFDALLLGIFDDQGELRYIGRVASGFTDAQLGLVWKHLHTLKSKTSPFAVQPDTNGRAHWVKPKLSIRVQFGGWTKDGRLRRPVFDGVDTNGKRERAHKERNSVAADATGPDRGGPRRRRAHGWRRSPRDHQST